MNRILRARGWTLRQWQSLPSSEQEWWRADERRRQKRIKEIMGYKWIIEDNKLSDPMAFLTLLLEQM